MSRSYKHTPIAKDIFSKRDKSFKYFKKIGNKKIRHKNKNNMRYDIDDIAELHFYNIKNEVTNFWFISDFMSGKKYFGLHNNNKSNIFFSQYSTYDSEWFYVKITLDNIDTEFVKLGMKQYEYDRLINDIYNGIDSKEYPYKVNYYKDIEEIMDITITNNKKWFLKKMRK